MNDEPRSMVQRLGTDSRVLIQARRLPMSALTDEHISDVRKDFFAYTAKLGIFDAQVAKEVDLAPATISQWRSGVYQGDNERIARVLNDWMERHARKHRAALPAGFIRTRVAEEIKTLVDAACTTGSMAAIVAPSGTGKTMVLQFLADKYRGRYIYCNEDLSPREFLRKIAASLDIRNHMTKGMILEAICGKLRGTNRPLFLDEAHRLPRDTISRIRTIHDETGVPVIMAGAAEILDSINDRRDGHGQFAGRCLQYNALSHVANVEDDPGGGKLGRPLFSKDEVRAFLEGLSVKLDTDGFELAWAVACLPNHSCLRTVRRVVHLLRPDAAKRLKPITRKEFLWALSLLFDQQGNAIARSADLHIQKVKAA